MSKRTKKPLQTPSMGTSVTSEIVIIHLSDLHIGDTHRFPVENARQCKTLGVQFGRAIREEARRLGVGVERAIVAVTGDLTNTGQPDEFDRVVEILQGLGGELGVGNNRFVICPGNHDIDWYECEIAELQGKQRKLSPADSRREVDRRKFDNYRSFQKRFYGDSVDSIARPIELEARRQDFEDLRVSVIAINTCERESHRREDHLGAVTQDQAQAICDAWISGGQDDWVRIMCVHHNPDRTAPDNLTEIQGWLEAQDTLDASSRERIVADIAGFEGSEFVRRAAQDARVSVLLHGHQHEPDIRSWKWPRGGETLIIAAGSAGVDTSHLPGEQPNQIRVIVISPNTGKIRVRTLVLNPRARHDGSVETGAFVSGTGERDEHDGQVYLPASYMAAPAIVQASPRPILDSQLLGFLETYRQRLSHTWADWDLKGMAAVGAVGRPVTAGLDEMYQPLRLGTAGKEEAGMLLEASDLIKGSRDRNTKKNKPRRALLIRGPAGAGKTTWMRFTFRRLLENPMAVPFMLVLRDVAARWSQPDCAGQKRSLDSCIRDSVAERMGEGWNADVFLRVLTAPDGPRPVLMVDGWDELGDHGKKLREMLLGFMQQHRRVLVVVSTRPWGDGVPDGAHGFEVLEVQPLSDPEVKSFARRFFKVCYSLDDSAVDLELPRFLERLEVSAEAKVLARTALFLTMMLVVSRHKPLPEKRHQLYRECLSTLLKDRPDTWAREGVQRNRDWWRPEDAEQRWKAVARLAAELQAKGYEGERKAVVAHESDIVAALPATWAPNDRRGFLWWLIGEAGLITDRADGTYTFAHLSFQEYLTAWHLHASVSDGIWAGPVLEHARSESWWETLLLYAAEVGSTSDERADAIIDTLISRGNDGLSIAGMVLADGGGNDAKVKRWADAWVAAFAWPHKLRGWRRCSIAWAGSQQTRRREILGTSIHSAAALANWWQWQRLFELSHSLRLQPFLPEQPMISQVLQLTQPLSSCTTPESVGISRILLGHAEIDLSQPQWLLTLWPSRRRRLSARLQSAILAGASQSEVITLARRSAYSNRTNIVQYKLIQNLLNMNQKPSLTREVYEREIYKNSHILLAEIMTAHGIKAESLSLINFFSNLSDFMLNPWQGNIDRGNNGKHGITWHMLNREGFSEHFASMAARESEFDGPWLMDHLRVEFMAVDRWALPWFLADGVRSTSEASLMNWTYKNSFGKLERFPSKLASEVHPIWPALAKYVTSQATEQDKDFLVDLASHPEKTEPPLSWALQYVIRGDLVLRDGSTVTLDDYLRESDLPSLPLIEEAEPNEDVFLSHPRPYR